MPLEIVLLDLLGACVVEVLQPRHRQTITNAYYLTLDPPLVWSTKNLSSNGTLPHDCDRLMMARPNGRRE